MRVLTRSLLVGFVAVLGVIGLAVAWTAATVIQLLATTALIMGGTNHSLDPAEESTSFVGQYLDNAIDRYIDPSAEAGNGTAGPVDNAFAVDLPRGVLSHLRHTHVRYVGRHRADEPQEVPRCRQHLVGATPARSMISTSHRCIRHRRLTTSSCSAIRRAPKSPRWSNAT